VAVNERSDSGKGQADAGDPGSRASGLRLGSKNDELRGSARLKGAVWWEWLRTVSGESWAAASKDVKLVKSRWLAVVTTSAEKRERRRDARREIESTAAGGATVWGAT
jgi:hypothetical protein